jgi:hypothetical protein
MDTYLTDEAAASTQVFRVYRETPPRYPAGAICSSSNEAAFCFVLTNHRGGSRNRGDLFAGARQK